MNTAISEEQAWKQLHELAPTEVPLKITCADGVTRWLLPPGNARGCDGMHADRTSVSFHATVKSIGARKPYMRIGFMWPFEEMVYANERSRIIREILAGCDKGIPDFDYALARSLKQMRDSDKKPKPTGKAKLQIKQVSGKWWLFHRQWTPLSFESFEEATAFAKRFILRIKVSPSPVAA